MNKKGFTLVELLATIVIIGLLAGIATVAYGSLIAQGADTVFKAYEDTMHAEAAYKLTQHYDEVTFTNNVARLSLNDLRIDPIKNPKKSSDLCPNSYVEVIRSRTEGNRVLSITYKVCLICDDYVTTTKNADGTTSQCRIYEN